MRLRSKVLLILLAVQATALACDSPPPFGRLVDQSQRIGAVSEPESLLVSAPAALSNREGGASVLPTATIDDDTRYVLATPPLKLIADREIVATTEPGLVVFKKSMAGLFPGAESLLIEVHSFTLGQAGWQIQPPLLRRLEELGEDQMFEIEVKVEDAPVGMGVEFWVKAYQVPPVGGTRYVTPARLIPEGSRLEFAFGILEAAVLQGPVRFSILACEQSRCEVLFSEVHDPAEENRAGWQERSISLSSLWGQARSLEFEAVPVNEDAVSLPVWADPKVVSEARGPSKPNVILLSIDTLRRDHLSVYGYERDTSPFMKDYLATNGIVFDNLISEAATTDASHMCLFTSLPALVHGATKFGTGLEVPVVTLAEAFRNQGYDTGAFAEGGPLVPRLGFGIGFDRWKENPSLFYLFPMGQVERTFAQGLEWIEQRQNRPFFVFLHTFQVHAPLSPPRSYLDYFLDEEDDVEHSEEFMQVVRYDQEIRYVDDQLAILWGKLQDRGIAQNTILVLVSDHGDEFWEHGARGHASLPYEEVLDVPLIVVGPGLEKGLRSQRSLHHVDIMPTILDLAGIPIPEHALGESFADSVRDTDAQGETGTASRIRISASWIVPPGTSVPAFAIRNRHLKAIRYQTGPETKVECFDIENDPKEKVDLCAEGPTEEATQLLERLGVYESAMEAKRLSLGGEGLDESEADAVSLSPEQEAQLRELGYVE